MVMKIKTLFFALCGIAVLALSAGCSKDKTPEYGYKYPSSVPGNKAVWWDEYESRIMVQPHVSDGSAVVTLDVSGVVFSEIGDYFQKIEAAGYKLDEYTSNPPLQTWVNTEEHPSDSKTLVTKYKYGEDPYDSYGITCYHRNWSIEITGHVSNIKNDLPTLVIDYYYFEQ
jgi:hypothetical protein